MAVIQGNGLNQKDLVTFMTNVTTMCNEIKADYNTLRAELIKHDHGATGAYSTGTLRLKTGAATLTSTDSTAVATTDLTLTV